LTERNFRQDIVKTTHTVSTNIHHPIHFRCDIHVSDDKTPVIDL